MIRIPSLLPNPLPVPLPAWAATGYGLGGVTPITSLAFVGDSTTAEAGSQGISPFYPAATSTSHAAAWANAVSWAVGKRVPVVIDTTATPPLVAFARSGEKSDHVLATQIPAILASPTLPSHVVWKIGTNDVSQSYSIVTSESNIRTGIATLKAAGIESIITTINPRRPVSGKTADVAAFNELLAVIAAETKSLFIDSRDLLEGSPGTEKQLALYDGVHQWESTNFALAADFADKIADRLGPMDDPFDAGPLIHSQADIVGTLPSGQTTSQTTIARDDGVAGNWYRCSITGSPSIVIGSGNSGVSYAPVSPETNATVFVFHRINLYNSNFTNGGLPLITVSTATDGRKIIEVRSETSGLTSITTAAQVVAAITASAEASALVTASLVGDGTGIMTAGSGWNSWSLLLNNSSTPPTTGQYIRLICELRNSAPMRNISNFRLWRTTPLSASLRTMGGIATPSGVLIPARKWVLTTPWYQVQSGDSGWRGQIQFGGALGNYDIGRFGAQVYQP